MFDNSARTPLISAPKKMKVKNDNERKKATKRNTRESLGGSEDSEAGRKLGGSRELGYV